MNTKAPIRSEATASAASEAASYIKTNESDQPAYRSSRRNDHGTKRGNRAVDGQEPKATVASLRVKNPIEWVAVLVA
jgi:hypothetical protein